MLHGNGEIPVWVWVKIDEEDAIFATHDPGRDSVVAEPGSKDEDIKILVLIHRLDKNALIRDLGNWAIYEGCVVSLERLKIAISGYQAATPRLVGFYELRHRVRVIARPHTHQLLYVGSEGRLHVLADLVEDEILEDTIDRAFEPDALFQEFGRLLEGCFLPVPVLKVRTSWSKLGNLIHADPSWMADVMCL